MSCIVDFNLAGLHPSLVQKCYEHGAQTIDDALRVANQAERALEAINTSPYSNNQIHCMPVMSQSPVEPIESKIEEMCDKLVSQNRENTGEIIQAFEKLVLVGMYV